jgi:hypothetical protein
MSGTSTINAVSPATTNTIPPMPSMNRMPILSAQILATRSRPMMQGHWL